MNRFYEKRISEDGGRTRFHVTVKSIAGSVEVEIDRSLFDELDELQREFWRIERRESRHTVHLERIPDCYLPHELHVKTPEQLLIDQVESTQIHQALQQIPEVQRRRFLHRHLVDLPIRTIASMENCSTRAIEYSLSLARQNLKDILQQDSDGSLSE